MENIERSLKNMVQTGQDEDIANYVRDEGMLGVIVRETLVGRGHVVNYQNVNGVVTGGVTFAEKADAGEARADSVNPADAHIDTPNQTVSQPATGVDMSGTIGQSAHPHGEDVEPATEDAPAVPSIEDSVPVPGGGRVDEAADAVEPNTLPPVGSDDQASQE